MSKRKAKKKGNPQTIVRTDVWDLVANPEQKHQMALTVAEYRKFLKHASFANKCSMVKPS